MSKDRDEIWDEWGDLINMTHNELDDWLDTEESKSVGDSDEGESTGHESGRKILDIMETNKDDLSDDQWDWMGKTVGYVKRHLSQGGPDDGVEESDWRYSLMNWGHDPCKD